MLLRCRGSEGCPGPICTALQSRSGLSASIVPERCNVYGAGCSVDTAIVLERTKLYLLLNTQLAFMLLLEIEVKALLE